MFSRMCIILMAGIALANFFCINNVAVAYDLPSIQIEKPNKNIKSSATNDKNDQDIPNNENIQNNVIDKNYVFVGTYKGFNYYIDRYSIKIRKNNANKRSWSQFIFPIGPNVNAINATSTRQRFFYDGTNAYNSTRKNNLIDDIEDEETKIFLWKCFKIGYQCAFNEEFK